MKCPYCESVLTTKTLECPHCHANLENEDLTSNTAVIDNPEKKTSKVKKKYLIMFCSSIILFLILIGFAFVKNTNLFSEKKESSTSSTTTSSTTAKVTLISKNIGVYSGLESPIEIGGTTIATLVDSENKVNTDVDVSIVSVLDAAEVNAIALANNYTPYEGFRLTGVTYQVTFNDLTYLQERKITPVLSVSLHDELYKNNFFLVNENYYTIKAVTDNSVMSIGNGESAQVKIIYQVPIDQNYYLCFGERSQTFGCFKGI